MEECYSRHIIALRTAGNTNLTRREQITPISRIVHSVTVLRIHDKKYMFSCNLDQILMLIEKYLRMKRKGIVKEESWHGQIAP